MGAFIERAQAAGSCLLVVTRSSNPEGRGLQSTGGAANSVEATLLRDIGALNCVLAPDGLGPIGAVIGPTHLVPSLDLRAANSIFLAPGVGAQGASPEDVAEVFADCPDRVIPSASRLLLEGGPDLARLRDRAGALAAIFRDRLP
jgi:orotidine-5'-phosphate decarboxylase